MYMMNEGKCCAAESINYGNLDELKQTKCPQLYYKQKAFF